MTVCSVSTVDVTDDSSAAIGSSFWPSAMKTEIETYLALHAVSTILKGPAQTSAAKSSSEGTNCTPASRLASASARVCSAWAMASVAAFFAASSSSSISSSSSSSSSSLSFCCAAFLASASAKGLYASVASASLTFICRSSAGDGPRVNKARFVLNSTRGPNGSPSKSSM